ncbi:MAG: hypothetical protein HDKAJFGB_02844 [Anaerolineae bacterium]|nr:hypothetical protein [Anaerolineae bacterium]
MSYFASLRWVALALMLALALAACTSNTPVATSVPPTSALSSLTFTEEDINRVTALAHMKGHLRASLPLWEAGNYTLASTHSGHPTAELFPIVEDELKQKQADVALKNALSAYNALAGTAGDAAKVKAANQAALDAVDAATQALAGPLMNDIKFRGEVIRGLLGGVEGEYGEAVRDGKLVELIEYQDAFGFFTVAREYYQTIQATVEAEHPNEHAEIMAQFAKLEATFPGVTPPAQVAAPDEVNAQLDIIMNALGKALGLSTETMKSPAMIVTEIREKVEQSLKAYQDGKTDEAYELAASAYLNGFEQLEADLLKKDTALVETLEVQFKDLRDGIKSGKPLAELETLAAQINANLDKVESLHH